MSRFVRTALLGMAACALAHPAAAQNSECAGYGGQAGNVCNAAVEGTRLLYPAAGILLGGGQPLLGPAAGLGPFPRFGLMLRVNAAEVQLPSLDYDGSTPTVPAGESVVVPAPLLEGELGLWDGLSSGLLRTSLLLSVQFLPTGQVDNFAVDPDATSIGDAALGFGYGLRVGILDAFFPVPNLGVSVMRRTIPDVRYGDLAEPDQDYEFTAGMAALNLRASADWRFAGFQLAGGLGYDRYSGDATAQFRDPISGLPEPAIALDVEETRWLAYLDFGLNLGPGRLGLEVGWQFAEDQEFTSDFEEIDEDAGRVFGGLAFGLSF